MNKTEYVYHHNENNYNPPPYKLKEFIEFFGDILSKIPEECRDSAIVEFGLGYHDDSYISIEVSYTRPETDVERLEREQLENYKKEEQKRKELETLEELKRKYENQSDV